MEKDEIYYSLIDSAMNEMREIANDWHKNVNQYYDNNLEYGFHLDKVVDNIIKFYRGNDYDELSELLFGGYFHDTIEDTRHTYNDVLEVSKTFFKDKEQCKRATEIVYALTELKGRNRIERHSDVYLQGICDVPYAPFVKLCDVAANATYAFENKAKMFKMYKKDYQRYKEYFLENSNPEQIASVIEYLDNLFNKEV